MYDSDKASVTLLGLEPGQEMAPHASASEVLLNVVRGRGTFLVANEESPAETGSTMICAPNCSYGIRAKERMVVMAVMAPRPL